MEVIIKANAEEVSTEAAGIFRRQISHKPSSVLGLATGSTPLRLYRELIAMHSRGEVDFSAVTTFNLDEYVGLGADHPHSYTRYMREHFFLKVGLPVSQIHIPDGMASDIQRHCADYEQRICDAGGIDLQLLGLGVDGHIGFNEPSSSLSSRTRLKTLSEQTIEDNARYFSSKSEVPRHVITMGIGTIMEARRCVVLATGSKKAAAVASMVEGPVTASVPASILQMHPVCTLVIDAEAAANLRHTAYYRWVYENKPALQRT